MAGSKLITMGDLKDFVTDFIDAFEEAEKDNKSLAIAIYVYKLGYTVYSVDKKGSYLEMIKRGVATGSHIPSQKFNLTTHTKDYKELAIMLKGANIPQWRELL